MGRLEPLTRPLSYACKDVCCDYEEQWNKEQKRPELLERKQSERKHLEAAPSSLPKQTRPEP